MIIQTADLYKELSETELLQLSDINGTGNINQLVVDDAIADALAFIESFFQLPEEPTPLLKKIAIDLSIYELRRKNSLIDDTMKSDRKEWESYLFKMAKNLIPTSLVGGNVPAAKRPGVSFVHSRVRTDTSGLGMP